MISKLNRKIVILIFIICVIFIACRAKQYYDDRKNHNHDTYMVVKGEKYEKCPDMDMFGFKFSVMLVLMGVNLFLTTILVMSS